MIDPQDIIPVSELQDSLRAVLARAQRSKRPVVVTQRGRPAGVLLDVDEYRRLVELSERAEFDEDVARGERALAAGQLSEWSEVRRELLEGTGE